MGLGVVRLADTHPLLTSLSLRTTSAENRDDVESAISGAALARIAMLYRESCESLSGLAIVIYKTQPLGYNTDMDKKLIAKVMAELGKRTSKAKAAAARENGKKGGRPRRAKVKR
jgi:hypothetical protein